jgi:hypothetical protein
MPGHRCTGPISCLHGSIQKNIIIRAVLPLSQEYENSGEFTFKQRMKKSIIVNLLIYAVGAFLGLIWIIYMLIEDGFQFKRILGFFVVLSNTM